MADLAVVLGFLAIMMAPCLVALDLSSNDRPYEGDIYDLTQSQE